MVIKNKKLLRDQDSDNERYLYNSLTYKIYCYYLIQLDDTISDYNIIVDSEKISVAGLADIYKTLVNFSVTRYLKQHEHSLYQRKFLDVSLTVKKKKISLKTIYFKFLKLINDIIEYVDKHANRKPVYNNLTKDCLHAFIVLTDLSDNFIEEKRKEIK